MLQCAQEISLAQRLERAALERDALSVVALLPFMAQAVDHLNRQLTGDRPLPWVSNLPHGFRVVACTVDPTRQGLVLTLYSETFPVVPAGEPIPELMPQFANGR